METERKKDTCVHNLPVKLQSGVNAVNVKPLFNYNSQNIMIACGSDVKVFAIKSGECLQTLRYHSKPIVSLRENKKNMLQFFSCSDDGVVVKWDYHGSIIKVFDLQMPVINFYAPTADGEWFVTKKFENQNRLYSLIPKQKGCNNVHMILKPVLPRENSISFGVLGKFVASVYENNLTIYSCESKNTIRHKTGERNLTCVASHPTDFVLATGDNTGRVIVWTNALESNHPIRSIYHWHTLPVSDLAFSFEGSHIHSVGGEAALVKWNLFSEEKYILPRLGAPITYVVSSKQNYILTTHSDNVLQVIDPQRNIVRVIHGLTRSEPLYGKLLPVGLLYDSHLKSLVLNGKPGHLQFYDIKEQKQLYNLDIVRKNYFCQERDAAVYNIEVQKAALDDTGTWLATADFWTNADCDPYINLKFWKYDFEEQTFTLNAKMKMAHKDELNCIKFKPDVVKCQKINCKTCPRTEKLYDFPLVVTTSQDGQIGIWSRIHKDKDGQLVWRCENMRYYSEKIPGSATFCEDGSVVAVAYGKEAVLWNVLGLTKNNNVFARNDIKQLLFGRRSGFKYLLAHDGTSITCWDCTTLRAIWILNDRNIQLLVRDNATGNFACFCRDQNLKIFNPEYPKPLDNIPKVSDSPIVSALFVPSANINSTEGCFNEKSELFFIDEAQNLFTVSEVEEVEEVPYNQETDYKNLGLTPFGMLQAEETVSDVKTAESDQFVLSNELEESDIISIPTFQDLNAQWEAIFNKHFSPKPESEKVEEKKKRKKKSAPPAVEKPKHIEDIASGFQFDDNWLQKALDKLEFKDDLNLDFSGIGKMMMRLHGKKCES